MGLIKKIDVDNYFAAKRARRLGKTGLLSPSAAPGTKPAGKPKSAPRSIGNRTQGRASPIIPADVVPMIPSSGARRGRMLPDGEQE
jgi:hypothetical protein